MKNRGTIFIILFLLCPALIAQNNGQKTKKKEGSISGQPYVHILYHQGLHWNRTEYLDELFSDGFRAMEARIGLRTFGTEPWQQLHRCPKYGLGINFADEVMSKGDTALSNPLSFFVFYNTSFFRDGRISFGTNTSVGLSYTSLVYHPETNPYNDILASHINLYFDFSLVLGVELGERFDLSTGYGVTHYSNGNIHEPQKGLNNWGWNVGLSYLFGGGQEKPFTRKPFIYSDLPEFKPFEEVQFMFGVGIVEWQPKELTHGVHYFTASFTTDYAVRFSPKGAFTLGVDVMYDGSLERHFKGLAIDEVSTLQKFYLGGHTGYQHTIDRLTLLVNLGVYVVQSNYIHEFFFARAGGRIRLTDHLAAHICIKSKNGIRSDWIEWGLAYSIKTR